MAKRCQEVLTFAGNILAGEGTDDEASLMVQTLGRHAWAELADHLADMIVDGRMPPGHRLVEAEVAESFGISRGPVRTALAALERQGLAEPKGRRGLAVVEMTVNDIRELFEVRSALELAAVTHLAENANEMDLAPLHERLRNLDLAAASESIGVVEVARTDLHFHRGLCELTRNARLLRSWENLSSQILLVMGTLQGGNITPVRHLFDHHAAVLEALESDQPHSAAEVMKTHLDRARILMVEAMQTLSESRS